MSIIFSKGEEFWIEFHRLVFANPMAVNAEQVVDFDVDRPGTLLGYTVTPFCQPTTGTAAVVVQMRRRDGNEMQLGEIVRNTAGLGLEVAMHNSSDTQADFPRAFVTLFMRG